MAGRYTSPPWSVLSEEGSTGAVAQLGERLGRIEEVVGSSPIRSTSTNRNPGHTVGVSVLSYEPHCYDAGMKTTIALLAFCLAAFLLTPMAHADSTAKKPRVLVFSKTAGFRHGSIPYGIKAIQELGREYGWAVDATEDANAFTEKNLRKYDAVVFLNTTGDVLDEKQQEAFEAFIRNGNGYMGIHSAADTEYDWPFYGEMIGGAYFKGHPRVQKATVIIDDKTFPATRMLPEKWERTDEWYVFRESPRKRRGVVVVASLDESTYEGGGMNGDHPIAWYQEFEGGRAFYTGGGHTNESFSEPLFREHLAQGVRWTAGLEKTPPKKATPIKDPAKVKNRSPRKSAPKKE